jgi:hypothetical protein
MARCIFDPLAFVPRPETVRTEIAKTLSLAERLRILLELAERMHIARDANSAIASQPPYQEVDRG